MNLENIRPFGYSSGNPDRGQINESYHEFMEEYGNIYATEPVLLYTAEQMQEYAKAKVHKALKEVEYTTLMNGYIFSLHIDNVVARTFGETDERTK